MGQVLEDEVEGFVEVDAGVDAGYVEFWEVLVEVTKGVLEDVCSFVADGIIELLVFLLY